MGIGLLNYPKFRGEDDNGTPLTGGLLYTYDAGTSTPRASYIDKDCTVMHTNPIILDARGEAVIYLSGDYKLILTDSDGVLIWTMDNIQVINPADINAFYSSINAAINNLASDIELNMAAINIRLDNLEGSSTVASRYIDKVWSFQTAEKEPNYSTVIGPYTVLDGATPRKALLFCSQNWLFYALDVHTGQEIWSQINDGPMYGRMQAVDLYDNGVLKIYVPCNAGHIKRVNANGEYDSAFTFYNVYDREGSGSVTSSGSQYIVDNTKSWHNNAFIRVYQPATDEEAELNAEVEFTSGAAAGQRRRISYQTNGNMLYLYGGRPTGVTNGNTFVIHPAYDSDRIFMHAGQLIKEEDIWFLYATSQDSHIYKINAHTGALVWKYAGLEAIEAWPLIGDLFQNGGRYVLWGCYDRHLRCHNATTGAVIWM
jgi:outer membrane protein assembly factor BamB